MACDGRFTDDSTGYSIVFDDDGRVAYAYLLDESEVIIGDVWLYNRCNTPKEPEWKNSKNIPFANSDSYVNELAHDVFQAVDDISDVRVDWRKEAGKVEASILIRGKLFAVLIEGIKLGSSSLAGRNGPLAKVLEP